MSYLVATTTYANFMTRFQELISGNAADDFGNTCAIGDRWRVLGNGAISQPESTAYLMTQEHRAGYWTSIRDNIITNDGSAGANTFIRQISVATAWPTNFAGMEMTIRVATANTVAFDYSTAILDVAWTAANGNDAYTTTTANNFATANWWQTNTTTEKPAADGTYTVPLSRISNIANMTVRLGDPSGFLSQGANFIRFFTPEHPGGYDYWKGFEHALPSDFTSPTATNELFVFTVGNELSGVKGTDWDTCGYATFIPPTRVSYSNGIANYHYTPPGNQGIAGPSGMSSGIGYKTEVSLTGEHYEVKFKVYDSVGSLVWAENGQTLRYRAGTWGHNGGSQIRYGFGGSWQGIQVCKPFGANPINTASIQMFISVTPEWLAVVLVPDAAYGGITTGFHIARINEEDPLIERGCWVIPWYLGSGAMARLGPHSYMEILALRQKGYRDGGRDWQTQWGRNDIWHSTDINTGWVYNNKIGAQSIWHAESHTGWHGTMIVGNKARCDVAFNTNDSNHMIGGLIYGRNEIYPDGVDNRVPSMQPYLVDNAINSAPSSSEWRYNGTQQNYVGAVKPRGFVKSALVPCSQGGWLNGDEIEEIISGERAILFLGPNGDIPAKWFPYDRFHMIPTYYGAMLRQL